MIAAHFLMDSPLKSKGRKPTRSENASDRLNLRLTPTQRDQLEAEAQSLGVSTTELVRRKIEQPGVGTAFATPSIVEIAAQVAERLRGELMVSPSAQICISLDAEKRSLAEATAKKLQVGNAETMLQGLMNWAIMNPEAAQAAFPVAEVEEIAKSRAARALAPKAKPSANKSKKAA